MIEFRDVDNIAETVYRYSAEPHKLGCIYVSPSNILFYEDRAKRCSVVRAIDCSFMPPKEVQDTIPITVRDKIKEMCLLQDSQQLLITVHESCKTSWIQAFDVASGSKLWEFNLTPIIWHVSHIERMNVGEGPCDFLLCGYTTNGICRFSSDGRYLGFLPIEGGDFIQRPRKMKWNNEAQCLDVAHERNRNEWFISTLNMNENIGGIT